MCRGGVLGALCVYTPVFLRVQSRCLGCAVCMNPCIVEWMGVVSQVLLHYQRALCHTHRPGPQGCQQAGTGQTGERERDEHGAELGGSMPISVERCSQCQGAPCSRAQGTAMLLSDLELLKVRRTPCWLVTTISHLLGKPCWRHRGGGVHGQGSEVGGSFQGHGWV